MAKGNEIIVSTEPKGRFEGCIIDGTPKPGTCMQMKAATEPVQGQYTFEVYNKAADGLPAPVIVLREDNMQGKTATAAYADNDQGFLYWPQVGECLNMLVADPNAAIAIGDKYVIDDGTGKLVAAPSIPADYTFTEDSLGGADGGEVSTAVNANRKAIVFESLETKTDPGADVLVYCRCVRNC